VPVPTELIERFYFVYFILIHTPYTRDFLPTITLPFSLLSQKQPPDSPDYPSIGSLVISLCIITISINNYNKSAAFFCHQVAAWIADMFCNFYFAKNYKLAKYSTTTEAGEKKARI
jgi:hypothetical protein